MSKILENSIKKANCSICGGVRNCHVMGQYRDAHSDGDERYSYEWCVEWSILKCAGCDHVFVQTVSTNSDDYHQYYDYCGNEVTTYEEKVEYWPALSRRARPLWLQNPIFIEVTGDVKSKILSRISYSLKELYGALDGGLNMLAGIGIRTTFDIASEFLDVDPGDPFAKKLDAIVTAGGIGKVQRDHLEILIEAGNASAHRGWVPTVEQLDILMEILEVFIAQAVIRPEEAKLHNDRVAKVKDAVPLRRPRHNKKPAEETLECAVEQPKIE